ncbi:peptide ABC transporter substrate-binding protein [Bacillus dakarensis]|uniref:peptide ABC transporter substrate-binding protein n=1 Tax=Robertmurraya dakarensis TaxID=1926278 RepID=UPI0009816454|nr:peptide ABC transporter substrate-binding protein [Bacillus dakarensis]
MKMRKITFLVIILFLTACGNGVNSKDHLGEDYRTALDSIMNRSRALHNDMKFISIDMSNFNELDEEDKEEIMSFFKEKYKVDVMDDGIEQLKEIGLYNRKTNTLDGVLLEIEKVDYKFNDSIYLEGSKFHSGLGVTVHFKDGDWKVKETKLLWIS